MAARKLFAVMLNVSEARRQPVVEEIGSALSATKLKVALLNTFSDQEYNRTVYTVAGEADGIASGVMQMCRRALSLIDIAAHEVGQPQRQQRSQA